MRLLALLLGAGCDASAGTTVEFTPDGDGNLDVARARVRAGDTIRFTGLGPLDTIIEVGAPDLDGAVLCGAASLGADAHRVPSQTPTPPALYAGNELSGPFRTYPAGVYAMSVGSDECGYVERTGRCGRTEIEEAEFGGTRLCRELQAYIRNPEYVAPELDESAPGARPAAADPRVPDVTVPDVEILEPPLIPNPACVLGEILESTWADPGVQGVFVRLDWDELNPRPGEYDWSVLDRAFHQALTSGKTVTIGVRVGGNSIPRWVFDAGVEEVKLRDWGTGADSMPNADCGFEYSVASPSDPEYRTLLKQALVAMAAHIKEDQRRYSVLAGVKVTGMGMKTLENRLPSRCNIAVPDPRAGDTGWEGHLLDVERSTRSERVFDPKYASVRIKDVRTCVCNPQILEGAGYRPSELQSFYEEVETTLHDAFGYKHMTYMEVAEGFPQIGEGGRFLGDHLVAPIGAASPFPTVAAPPDIPRATETTKALIDDTRDAPFASAFGVENAALNPVPPGRCVQQQCIAATGLFAGSADFPIPEGTRIDGDGAGCPNPTAVREGVDHRRVTGFQVASHLEGNHEIDAALWNLTLNTNGLFFELYEKDAWLIRKQSGGGPLTTVSLEPLGLRPCAPGGTPTNKSAADWNTLLLVRAEAFSGDGPYDAYLADPFPSSYTVRVESAPGTERYFFNSRACQAYRNRGTPVRTSRIRITN